MVLDKYYEGHIITLQDRFDMLMYMSNNGVIINSGARYGNPQHHVVVTCPMGVREYTGFGDTVEQAVLQLCRTLELAGVYEFTKR